jgi:hypothetical protein
MFRDETFEADSAGHLPDQAEVLAKTEAMAKGLNDLRTAPITEPYNGPAILSGRAAAVFFHEVLGHRLEGQRQRGDEEGETFTKLLGKAILPEFLSVADDPTLTQYDGHPLSGHYLFDDEGQPAQRVQLVQDGVLDTFLMSRLPIASFANSNGHGRAEIGKMPTGRQGNLIVTSTKAVPEAKLRQMLKDAARKQGNDAPVASSFSGDSAGCISRVCGRPARRAGARRLDCRNAAGRTAQHYGYGRSTGDLQWAVRSGVGNDSGECGRSGHAGLSD